MYDNRGAISMQERSHDSNVIRLGQDACWVGKGRDYISFEDERSENAPNKTRRNFKN